jgi:hypothetical protein
LKAFTLSWKNLFDDPEPGFAKLTAHHLGIAHEILQEDSSKMPAFKTAEHPSPTKKSFSHANGDSLKELRHIPMSYWPVMVATTF